MQPWFIMGKLFLLTSFSLTASVTLFLTVLFLFYLSYNKTQTHLYVHKDSSVKRVAYAALPQTSFMVQTQVVQTDARIELVRQFFARYSSPLEPYAEDVVLYADFYNLDFRLIPAIAMQESNLCKKVPQGSYNCWGFGIYGKQVKKFSSFPEAIEQVTKTLALDYKNKHGLESPDEIMTRYTPSNNGSWANSVSYFMSVLK